MRKFKVFIDDDLVTDDAVGWSTPGGNMLVINYADGSVAGFSGFISFEVVVNSDDK